MKVKYHGVLPDVKIISMPSAHNDERGYFFESFRKNTLDVEFVQENVSCTGTGIFRGLHWQNPNPQGKLVSVISGAIYDIFVDIRKSSPTFGKYGSYRLEAHNSISSYNEWVYIPEGFAHGFVALQDHTKIQYKCTDYYNKDAEHCLSFLDPAIGIDVWAFRREGKLPTFKAGEKDFFAKHLSEFTDSELF